LVSFSGGRSICVARQRRYRHQFITKKLKDIAGDDEILKKDIEGVYGYLGDICCCIWLGIDPKEELRTMILDTDLLSHRDEYDLLYNGWRTDVKTEIYPDEKLEKAIRKQLLEKETYGCRLININHYLENSNSVDIYLFATIDNKDPRVAKNWIPIGWIYKEEVAQICPEPKGYSPSGARLWTKAYIIPNSKLRDLKELVNIKNKGGVAELLRSTKNRKEATANQDYKDLIHKVKLD